MKLSKRILKLESFRNFVCWLGSLYIRVVYATSSWQVVGEESPRKYWDDHKPFIAALWHGRILMLTKSWDMKATSIHMLISAHRDGELISKTISHLGIQTAVGSTSQGGFSALRNMLRIIKNGGSVGITPDGPRGPRMRASNGIVNLAKMTGVPIIPLSYSVRDGKAMSSWDRFIVPRPFTKGVFIWGDPIDIPRDADEDAIEIYRQKVEAGLNAVSAEADRLVGRPIIEAAPIEATSPEEEAVP